MTEPIDLNTFRPRLVTHPPQRERERAILGDRLREIAAESPVAFVIVYISPEGVMKVGTSTANVAHAESLLRRGVEYARDIADQITDRELRAQPEAPGV